MAQQAFSTTSSPSINVLEADSGGHLTIPGESWLLKADFAPQGSDLLLTGPDGAQVLIRDFFNLYTPPDLITETGAMIPADLAVKLAGPAAPGQFALLENGPFAELAQAAESIGRVEATDGLVEAIRVDGTKVALSKGDDVFQGDTLVTAKGAAIGITFVDDTTFSLGEEGRMVIDEMVYDPGTQEGQFSANLVQGVFSFVSGQIAKTGPEAMTVTTPVATIGIRGTKVAGRAAQEGSDNTISLLPEVNPDGTQTVGELSVTNQGGTVTLNAVGATVQMTSAFQAPPPPVVFSPQQIQQNFGSTLTTLTTTVAEKANTEAQQNAQEAEQAQEQAQAAEVEAEQAAAEAEAAAAEAEAAAAAAEAAGDPEAIAAAEAAAAEAEAKAAEAEAKAAEAEAKTAEAEAKAAEAAEAEAIAEHANNEMQAQAEAFAQFGGPSPDGPAEGDSPPEGEAPPDGEPQAGDGETPPDGDQQAADGEAPPDGEGEPLPEGEGDQLAEGEGGPIGEGPGPEGPGPDGGAIDEAAREATQAALDAGATQEEAAQAGFEAAREQAIAEGATPEEIAAAEQAFNDALAAGLSPEDAMQAAGDAAGQINPEGPGGPGPDGGDPNQSLPPGVNPAEVEQAATEAYEEALASGASREEAQAAANEAASKTVMAIVENQPFTEGSGFGDPSSQEGIGGPTAGEGDPNATGNLGGTTTTSGGLSGGDPFFGSGGGDPFFGGGDPFFGGGDPFFGGGDPFYGGGDPLYGGSGGDNFYDPYGGDQHDFHFEFNPLLDTQVINLGGPEDGPIDGGIIGGGGFKEILNASSSNDALVGGDDNTQFVMTQGSTLGGDDTVNGGGGTDEIAFKNLDDLWMVYNADANPPVASYSTSDSSVNGTVTLTSVEQLFVNDGTVSLSDASTNGAQTNANGIRLAFSDTDTGFGYIWAGSSAGNTIDLRDTDSAKTVGTVTHTIDDTKILGSIIFGKEGNDDITGTKSGDTIFGGADNDTFRIQEADSNNSDIMLGGSGDDTFLITADTGDNTMAGGSGTDTVDYSGLGTTLTVNFGSTSIGVNRSSNQDGLNGIETLIGGGNSDTFVINSGLTVDVNIDGSSGVGDTIRTFSSGVTMNGTVSNVEVFAISGSNGSDNITISGNFVSDADGTPTNHAFNGAFGGADNDTLTGNASVNYLTGGTGADTMDGAGASDTYYLSASAGDFASGESIADTGGSGTDTVTMTSAGAVDFSSGTLTGIETLNFYGADTGTQATMTATQMNAITTYGNLGGSNDQLILSSAATVNLSSVSLSGLELIKGSSGGENITGSTAGDTIEGGSGGDTMNGNGGADIFQYSELTDGASANAVTGYDTLQGFASGTEKIHFAGNLAATIDDVSANSVLNWTTDTGSGTAVDITSTKEAFRITSAAGLSDADLITSGWANVLGQINTNTITSGDGDDAIIAVQGTSDTAIYYYLEDTGGTSNSVEATELTLVSLVDNALLETSDFTTA